MSAGAAAPPQITRPMRSYAGYLFDLDGTIYLGDELLPGAAELVHALREQGRETLFLSNNPTKDPQMYADKLARLGIPTPVDRVLNPIGHDRGVASSGGAGRLGLRHRRGATGPVDPRGRHPDHRPSRRDRHRRGQL